MPGILECTTIFLVTPRTRVSSMRTCESSVTRCSIFASLDLVAGAVSTSSPVAGSTPGAGAGSLFDSGALREGGRAAKSQQGGENEGRSEACGHGRILEPVQIECRRAGSLNGY